MNCKMNKINKDIRFDVVHQIKVTFAISSKDGINNVFKRQIIILKELQLRFDEEERG